MAQTLEATAAAPRLDPTASRPVWIYEGALLFVTGSSCNYRDSPYKGDWRGTMTEGPRLSRPEFVFVTASHITSRTLGSAALFSPAQPSAVGTKMATAKGQTRYAAEYGPRTSIAVPAQSVPTCRGPRLLYVLRRGTYL
jgi:hypothetical protein